MIIGAFILMITAMIRSLAHATLLSHLNPSRVGGYDGLMTAYSQAEAEPKYSSFKEVDGANVSCFPIQAQSLSRSFLSPPRLTKVDSGELHAHAAAGQRPRERLALDWSLHRHADRVAVVLVRRPGNWGIP